MTTGADNQVERVYEAAIALWNEAQEGVEEGDIPGAFGHGVKAVRDRDIAARTCLELEEVRLALRELNGRRLAIGFMESQGLTVIGPTKE